MNVATKTTGELSMEIKCEYCGAFMNDTDKTCPNCGAVNNKHKRVADHTPKSIEELKKWYEDKNLPPYETTRFFIGIDYKKPRPSEYMRKTGNSSYTRTRMTELVR